MKWADELGCVCYQAKRVKFAELGGQVVVFRGKLDNTNFTIRNPEARI